MSTEIKLFNTSGHTRTSLLRTLNSSGHFNAEEWLLPETRQLFEKQAARQKKLAQGKHLKHAKNNFQYLYARTPISYPLVNIDVSGSCKPTLPCKYKVL